MHRYAYDNCPVCGLSFEADDDVVVCPSCGTPHHRECYKNNGGCANAKRHDEGYNFVSSAPDNKEETKEHHTESKAENTDEATSQNNTTIPDAFVSVMGHTIADGDEIEGVPVGDLKKFIGNSWVYYIPMFFAKVKGLRIFRINFSAFIGSFAWLFARKFYLLGLLSALITSASYFYMYFYVAYVMESGIDITQSITAIFNSSDQFVLIGYYIYSIVSYIPFVLSLLTGIFANRLYMKRCIKKVKKINATSTTAEQFNARLEKKGGLNLPLLFISLALVACYFILDERGIIESFMTQLINRFI